jgi:hypothetical protein
MKRFASRIVVGTVAALCLTVGSATAAIEDECSGPVSTNVRFGIAGTQLWLILADRAADGFIADGGELSVVSGGLSQLARALRQADQNESRHATKGFASQHAAASMVPHENGSFSYSVLTDDGVLVPFGQGGSSLGGFSSAGSAASIVPQASGGLLGSSVVSTIPSDHDFASNGINGSPDGDFVPYVPGAPLAIVMPAFPNETRHGMASSPPSPAGSALVPSNASVQELPEPSAFLVWGALALGGALVYRRHMRSIR